MAELRTLKHGRLYLLKDGSAFSDFAQAAVSSGGLFQKTDGTWGALMQESADFFMYSGGKPASIQAATPSAAINATNTVSKPVFYNDGSRIHVWYAYDETGTGDYELYYGYTDNNGTSWTSGLDLAVRGDQTWLGSDVWPLYFDYEVDGTDTHRLWVIGNNAGTYSLGYIAIDTSGGAFNTEIALTANYVAQSSGVTTHFDQNEALCKIGGCYVLYERNNDGIALRKSFDGATWSQLRQVFDIGLTGTNDDAAVQPYSVVVHQGVVHLLYGGSDGSVTTARLAVGESPDRLYKVPWMDVDTFGSGDLLVSYAADLTFAIPDQHRHVMDRNGPGALIDAPFVPSTLSFTARYSGELSSASGAFGWLSGLHSPEAGDDQATANATELGHLNIAYVMEDDAGSQAEFFLFPMVGIQSLEVTEGEDGDVITATGQMHSMQRPLFGSIT